MDEATPRRSTLGARLRAALPAVAVVACVALGGAVIVGSSLSAALYYRTVAEVAASGDAHVGETFRLAGRVAAGSVTVRAGARPDVRYGLADGDGLIQVHSPRSLPDAFSEGAEVVAEGRLVAPDRFEASVVIAKCPSKYEARLTPEDVARQETRGPAPRR